MKLGFILLLGLVPRITAAQSLRAGCEGEDREIAPVTPTSTVRVVSALAGGEQTCYQVVLTREGKEVTGYVLGEALPAVAAFVRERERTAAASFQAQAQWERTRAKPVPEASRSSADLRPARPQTFEDFTARDTTGNRISLSGMGGRVVLVTFWSPSSPASVHQLVSLVPLFHQYRHSGLRAIGISADPNPQHVLEALDDVTLGWPQVPDRSRLAERQGVNAKAGTTLVLDAAHHIVATALSGPELEQKVRELLGER
ncbi:MAG: TlpA family protein disulfide reductase [Acidobacteriia bacterium]|nr:TlpA family protein disulfide reductase [Terriglobia bacterium]